MSEVFKGKFFDAYLCGETLEIIPSEEVKGTLVFYTTDAIGMKKELEEIIDKGATARRNEARARYLKKAEELINKESMLDSMIQDVGNYGEFSEEFDALQDALRKFQNKAERVFPELKWKFNCKE